MKREVDVVVPLFNPPHGWSHRAIACMEELIRQRPQFAFKLILVDDGSHNAHKIISESENLSQSDISYQLLKHEVNKGKGAALRTGIGVSTADFTLYTDIDFPYDAESMIKVIDAVADGKDIVLGYREQDYYASVPWFRKGLSELFRFVLQRILHFPITDTQCGLKGMGKQGKSVFMQTRIAEFMVDMEFIKRAVNSQNMSIDAVVVKLRPNVVFSKMGLNVLLKEGLNFLRILFI